MDWLDMFRSFVRENFISPSQRLVSGTKNLKPRLEYFDLAKGICIILVVTSHTFVDDLDVLMACARPLRMPLFFMLSGIFFKDYGSFRSLMLRKINRLLVPFLFFTLLALPLAVYDEGSWKGDFLYLWDIHANFNYVLWFLLALFWDNFLFGLISVAIKTRWLRALVILLLNIVGWWLLFNQIQLPFALTQSLIGIIYFYVGSLFRCSPFFDYNPDKDKLMACLAFLVLMIIYALGYFFPDTAWNTLDFFFMILKGDAVWVTATNFLVAISVLLICKVIKWVPVVSYFGRYSIIVLSTHAMWIAVVWYIFELCGIERPQWLSLFLVLAISWLTIPVCKRYLPWFTAQKDLF